MELDDFLDKLKFLKSVPFLNGSGLDETIELGFRVFKGFHATLKANTITIGQMKKDLSDTRKTLAALKKRVEYLEDELYGSK